MAEQRYFKSFFFSFLNIMEGLDNLNKQQSPSQEGFASSNAEKKEEVKLTEREKMALEQLREPLAKMLEALRPQIENGDYDALIGDDASGRIPTLIMGEAIKQIYQEKGYEPPLVRFIAGSSGLEGLYSRVKAEEKREAVSKQIGRIKGDIEKRLAATNPSANEKREGKSPTVLIVTDTIVSGSSINALIEPIEEKGLVADVATVGLAVSVKLAEIEVEQLQKRWGGARSKIVYGMTDTPLIYVIDKTIVGVKKNREDLFSRRERDTRYSPNYDHSQQSINAARAYARDIANDLVEQFKRGSQKN